MGVVDQGFDYHQRVVCFKADPPVCVASLVINPMRDSWALAARAIGDTASGRSGTRVTSRARRMYHQGLVHSFGSFTASSRVGCICNPAYATRPMPCRSVILPCLFADTYQRCLPSRNAGTALHVCRHHYCHEPRRTAVAPCLCQRPKPVSGALPHNTTPVEFLALCCMKDWRVPQGRCSHRNPNAPANTRATGDHVKGTLEAR